MWKNVFLLTVVVAAMPPSGAPGQEPVPLGEEFQVNTYTSDLQIEPSVVVGPDGTFVVVWYGSEDLDGSGRGVFGQLFDSDGQRQGGEFQVNTTTTGDQALPEVAADAAGDFVVVWQTTTTSDIAGRRFTSSGDPLGDDFVVNSITENTQFGADLAMADDGDFVVVWQSALPGGDGFEIAGRRFASDGSPRGDDFLVNAYTTGSQGWPAVAMDGDEDFVVAWVDYGLDGDQEGVFAQRFAADGTPEGGQFQVNSYSTERQYGVAVARSSSGEFVVAWHGDSAGGSAQDIMSRRFTAQGLPIGDEFRINAFTPGSQIEPAVIEYDSGRLAVVWSSNFLGGGTRGISGQLLAADGTPNGGEFQVSSYTTMFQQAASVSAAGKSLVVTWDSDASSGPDMDESIQGQRFQFQEIFADGFESGDTAAWNP